MTASAAASAVQSVLRRLETHVVPGALKKHREEEPRRVSAVQNSSDEPPNSPAKLRPMGEGGVVKGMTRDTEAWPAVKSRMVSFIYFINAINIQWELFTFSKM